MSVASLRPRPCVRVLHLVALFSLILPSVALSAAPDALPDDPDALAKLCQPDTLPADIRGSLERNFSNWRIQQPGNLSSRAHDKWASERPLACPGIAPGHFQNARDSSYAILLVAADHPESAFRLLIFTQQAGQRFYGFKAVTEAATGARDLFVHTVPTSMFFDSGSKWTFHSRPSDSVLFVNSDRQEAYIFFWADNLYENQQVNY